MNLTRFDFLDFLVTWAGVRVTLLVIVIRTGAVGPAVERSLTLPQSPLDPSPAGHVTGLPVSPGLPLSVN